jgi:hypothetical protein
MRSTLLLLLLVSASARAKRSLATKTQPDDKTEVARAREAAAVTRKAAESYTITTGSTGTTALVLEPKSLLQWSNPVSG